MTTDDSTRGSRPPIPGRGSLARLWRPLALMLVLFGAIHLSGTTSRAEAADGSLLPCDRYAMATNSHAATPCVAAHSTVRLLRAGYFGPLYDVTRASDGRSKSIWPLPRSGYANAAAQDRFCAKTQCTMTLIYDQSLNPDAKSQNPNDPTLNHNDLIVTPKVSGNANHGSPDVGAPADALPTTAGGHPVYGISFSGHMGYHSPVGRVDIATGAQSEGVYMVTSGTHVNAQCCFDYGNAETSITDTGAGHMDAVNLGVLCKSPPCPGKGPWVRADLENGLFASNEGGHPNYTGDPEPYVTVMLKNQGQGVFTLKSGDARAARLTRRFSGTQPTSNDAGVQTNGYTVHKEGGIVLGTGGDDSDGSIGSFFEGVITRGYPADGADDDVQANIVSVGYGGPTGSVGSLTPGSEIALETGAPNSLAYLLAAPSGVPAAVATVAGPTPAATWIVRPGLHDAPCAGGAAPLSFEAKSYPGAFLRHSSAALYAVPDDGKPSTTEDETFCPMGGLSGQGGTTSLQVTTPGATDRYVGLSAGQGVTEAASGSRPQDGRASFRSDVSWIVAKPMVP